MTKLIEAFANWLLDSAPMPVAILIVMLGFACLVGVFLACIGAMLMLVSFTLTVVFGLIFG